MENKIVLRTANKFDRNKFFQELIYAYNINPDILTPAFQKYYIGTDNDGNCIFWQLDKNLHLFNGTFSNQTVWDEKDVPPGPFGGHLLRYHSSEIICIVKNPQHALLFSIYFPAHIWIACQTVNALQNNIPSNAKIKIFAQGNIEWARTVNNYLKSINLNSTITENKITPDKCMQAGPPQFEYDKPNFLNFTKEKFKPQQSLEQLHKLIHTNENFKMLSAELNLTVENIELYEK